MKKRTTRNKYISMIKVNMFGKSLFRLFPSKHNLGGLIKYKNVQTLEEILTKFEINKPPLRPCHVLEIKLTERRVQLVKGFIQSIVVDKGGFDSINRSRLEAFPKAWIVDSTHLEHNIHNQHEFLR